MKSQKNREGIDERLSALISSDIRFREKVISALESEIDEKIECPKNTSSIIYFRNDLENQVMKYLTEFKQGDEVVLNKHANSNSFYLKEGSAGIIKATEGNVLFVHLSYVVSTAENPPSSLTTSVSTDHVHKAKYQHLFKNVADHRKIAQSIVNDALQKSYQEEMGGMVYDPQGFFSSILGKIKSCFSTGPCKGEKQRQFGKDAKALVSSLAEEGHVSILNDEPFLESLKKDSLTFAYFITEGDAKYMKASGCVSLEKGDTYKLRGSDISSLKHKIPGHLEFPLEEFENACSSRLESAALIAEAKISEAAKSLGANYALIKRKDIIADGDSVTVSIEAVPLGIIGRAEIEQISQLSKVTDETRSAIKKLSLEGKLSETYAGMARFSPERFMKCLEIADANKQKEMLKDVIQLLEDRKLSNELSIALESERYIDILKEAAKEAFRDRLEGEDA